MDFVHVVAGGDVGVFFAECFAEGGFEFEGEDWAVGFVVPADVGEHFAVFEIFLGLPSGLEFSDSVWVAE